ncbi:MULTISPECIES: condensation domain-containing protein [unclassified Rhodococcus (in: high G+C Gram-positive bacteria)]|uniref:condensation domain-containing protein n=1 Tax=unclassified Rhodococcus (in: high G+C Gram-positive bacteria) TaxID=192944 RepID=UPI0015C670A6|nr:MULTISPECIES: condensation domain-containing protein [unclassified Rhodococcus (in: high G+C Gram-positive bacteria)]
MRVTSITEYTPRAGAVVEFNAVVTGNPQPSPVPPSFNQQFHLGDLDEAERVWIAGAFEVQGNLDTRALGWAFEHLIDRHDTLRSSFVRGVDGVARTLYEPGAVEMRQSTRTAFSSASTLRDHLRSTLELHCDARRFPSYTCLGIDRPDTSTILCAFDHSNVDAMSIAVVVDEIHTLYDAYRRCPPNPETDLPPVGGFVEYCRVEATRPLVDATDERMVRWSNFLTECGGTTPRFPLDLGVAEGETAPQATTVTSLLDAQHTLDFEQLCARSGAGMFAGVVAAIAQACAGIGGPSRVPFLFPLHTRHQQQFSRALGWFTTNAPMTVEVEPDLTDTITAAHTAFRAALPLSSVPIPQVLNNLGDAFTLSRRDVFMVSYIDYTKIGGHERFDRTDAHHISNATVSDDAQFWVSRTASGLALRSRFPDTATAHSVMDAFTAELVALMRTSAAKAENAALTL